MNTFKVTDSNAFAVFIVDLKCHSSALIVASSGSILCMSMKSDVKRKFISQFYQGHEHCMFALKPFNNDMAKKLARLYVPDTLIEYVMSYSYHLAYQV